MTCPACGSESPPDVAANLRRSVIYTYETDLCDPCIALWATSGERKRALGIQADRHLGLNRVAVAFMDFINRTRKERGNQGAEK